MAESPRSQVRELQSRNKSALKEILAEELGDSYNREITDSLRNDLMTACCERIDPGRDPRETVRSHENYSPSWSTKKQLATALRMLLTESVDHPEHDGITSLNKTVLAEIIVAIRQNTADTQDELGTTQPLDAPGREPLVEPKFDEGFPAANFDSYDLYSWIVERRSSDAGEHAVYVLDCTPPIGAEDFRMESLRQEAQQKSTSGQPLTKIEQAAQAVTRGERIYYVGYASDVPSRVRQHVSGADSGGAKFTNIFYPQALVEVSWYQTEATARSEETRRARELTVPGESFGYAE